MVLELTALTCEKGGWSASASLAEAAPHYLLAARIVRQLLATCMQGLTSVDRRQHHLVSHHHLQKGNRSVIVVKQSPVGHAYIVARRAQLVERHHVEPGALVAVSVERHAHGVLLEQGRQPLVHSQILVALDVEQLDDTAVLYYLSDQLALLVLVLLLLQLGRMLQWREAGSS